jgi:hypothetical protein
MKKHTPKTEAQDYQPLFDLMANDHNLTLTKSEMDDIISEALNVVGPTYVQMRSTISERVNVYTSKLHVALNKETSMWELKLIKGVTALSRSKDAMIDERIKEINRYRNSLECKQTD